MTREFEILPAIMAFDAAPDAVGAAKKFHTYHYVPAYNANEGIDHLAQEQIALYWNRKGEHKKSLDYARHKHHVFGGYRNYGLIPKSFDKGGQPGATAHVLRDGGPRYRAMSTHWVYGDTDVERGKESTLDDILAGKWDYRIVRYVKSLPIGTKRPKKGATWQFRLPIMGEVDVVVQKGWLNMGGKGKEPLALRDKAKRAVVHQIDVATKTAVSMKATPDEFGCGGLTTWWTMNRIANPTYSGYDWWTDLSKTITSAYQRRFVVGFVNPYFYHNADGTPEDPRPWMRSHKGTFAEAGINRYIISETTCGKGTHANRTHIVGTEAGQVQFVKWALECVEEGTLEWLGYFHAPGGYASDNGVLRGRALLELALGAQRVNF